MPRKEGGGEFLNHNFVNYGKALCVCSRYSSRMEERGGSLVCSPQTLS